MALDAFEFIRRFLLHTLPDGFHRIRHYGFLANGHHAQKFALCRKLLDSKPLPIAEVEPRTSISSVPHICPCCGSAMITLTTRQTSVRRARAAPCWNSS